MTSSPGYLITASTQIKVILIHKEYIKQIPPSISTTTLLRHKVRHDVLIYLPTQHQPIVTRKTSNTKNLPLRVNGDEAGTNAVAIAATIATSRRVRRAMFDGLFCK